MNFCCCCEIRKSNPQLDYPPLIARTKLSRTKMSAKDGNLHELEASSTVIAFTSNTSDGVNTKSETKRVFGSTRGRRKQYTM